MSDAVTPTPEVSVVLGVRNGGERIATAVRSVLAQRGVELELIVVDDGSTDATAATLAALAAADGRLRIVRQEPAGLTAALIGGCAEARAPFIARHDADEVSHPDRLRRQLDAFAAHPEVALVACWTAYVAPRGELLRVEKCGCTTEQPVPLFEVADDGRSVRATAGPTAHGSAMFRTALYHRVGGYRAAFAAGQDWDLWLRLGEHGPFLMVCDVLLSTTVDQASLSVTVKNLQIGFGEASRDALLRRLHGASEEEPLARAAELSAQLAVQRKAPRRRREALGLYHIGDTLRRQRHGAALSYLLRAVRRDPFLGRAWVRAAQTLLRRPTGGAPGDQPA